MAPTDPKVVSKPRIPMNSTDLQFALKLESRPSYHHGVAHGVPIAHLRSLQHKLSRRGLVNDLFLCCVMQGTAGFFLEPLRYFAITIVPEDLCNDAALVFCADTFTKWNKVINGDKKVEKKWPLSQEEYNAYLYDLYQVCAAVGTSKKCRFIPCMIDHSLHTHIGKWEPEANFESRVNALTASIRLCKESPTDDALDHVAVNLQNVLIHIEYIAKTKRRHGLRSKVWRALGESKVVVTAHQLDSIKSSNLLLMMAVYCVSNRATITKLTEPAVPFAKDWDAFKHYMEFNFSEGFITKIPDFANDKHTGGGGGYERFFYEGIWVPDDMQFQRSKNQRLIQRSYKLRMAYETEHGENSSKTAKVIGRELQRIVSVTGEKRSGEVVESVPDAKRPRIAKAEYKPILGVVAAQPVTGRHKKYVSVFPDKVLKGPFRKEETSLRENHRFFKLVSKLEKLLGLKSVLLKPVETLVNGAIFLEFPNVGKYEDIKTEVRDTKIATGVTVISRKTMIHRVSDICVTKLHPKVIQTVLFHAYLRFLAGVGDSGPWNMLLANLSDVDGKTSGRVYGIDMEESRTFTKTPTTVMEAIFSRRVAKSDEWSKHLSSMVIIGESAMEGRNFDDAVVERVRLFQNLFENRQRGDCN